MGVSFFDALTEAASAGSPIEDLADDRRWFLTYSVEFAKILADAAKLTTVEDTIYFFEKPWKWTPEYQKWRRAGSPDLTDPKFEEVWK